MDTSQHLVPPHTFLSFRVTPFMKYNEDILKNVLRLCHLNAFKFPKITRAYEVLCTFRDCNIT